MQLRADGLKSHLAKWPNLASPSSASTALKSCYTVFGDEPLLVQEALDAIRQAARSAGFTERSVCTVERGFDWSTLRGMTQSRSLFGERQLVEIRIPSGKPGKEGGAALSALAAANNPDALLLITLPRLDTAAQKTGWFIALGHAGITVRIDSIERAQLPDWIGQRLAAQGQPLAAGETGRQVAQFITEKTEGNLLAAHQEIQKLALLYPRTSLSLEQVQDAVLNVARYDVFKLGEAMLAADAVRIARILDGLCGEGCALVLVLWAIVEEIRKLLRIKRGLAAGQPLALLLRENRIWGARERLVGPAAARVDESALERGLMLAARLDRQIKGLDQNISELPPNPWDGLFVLAMTMVTCN